MLALFKTDVMPSEACVTQFFVVLMVSWLAQVRLEGFPVQSLEAAIMQLPVLSFLATVALLVIGPVHLLQAAVVSVVN